ncbi:hypothetical protein DFP72DRAFT_860271 [Ephemerocybe angulata]|uniref:Uncharacterized protein n=1 Tax=Ephemerocybe angulata TaxID=980116 RepID=A0A8H6H935_9AGAR|nr:hypothetical protein DFP72DRAFT_860271 [Tulosesus angulatus]
MSRSGPRKRKHLVVESDSEKEEDGAQPLPGRPAKHLFQRTSIRAEEESMVADGDGEAEESMVFDGDGEVEDDGVDTDTRRDSTNGVEETDGDIDADVVADSKSASGGVREGMGSESEESDSDYEEENLDDDDERKEWWVDRVVCHRLKKQKNGDSDSQEMEYLLLFEASPIPEWVGVNRINSGCTHLIKQYWDSLNQTQFDQEVTTSNVLSLWDSSMAKTDISRFESLLDKVEIEKELQSVKEVVSVVANIPASRKTATLMTILEGWLKHNSHSVSRELAGLYQIMEVAQALPATARENAQKSNGGIGAAAAAYLLEASFENFYQLSPSLAQLTGHLMHFAMAWFLQYEQEQGQNKGSRGRVLTIIENKIPWRPKDTLTLINTVLNSALVYPALLKYDKVFALRPNKGESASGFTHHAILRDAFLSCLAEACNTDSILISPRLQSLLISPQFVSGNSNCQDFESDRPAIQPLLSSNVKESLKEMSAALHGCIADWFSAASLSQHQAKYKHNGHPIKFGAIILDMVTPLNNTTQKNQIPDLGVLSLIMCEALQHRNKEAPVIEELGRVLTGAHATRTSHTNSNPDHFNPCRVFNCMSDLVQKHLGNCKITGPYGWALTSLFSLGRGRTVQKFARVITCNMFSVLEDMMRLDDIQQYGSANNLLLAQLTIVSAHKATLEEKFKPYFSQEVINVWVGFMGDVADKDHLTWTGPKPTWRGALDIIHRLRICGIAGLTALQLVNSLALLEDDKKTIGFNTLFVEHLLYKVVHWARRLKGDNNTKTLLDYTNNARRYAEQGREEVVPYPCPLIVSNLAIETTLNKANSYTRLCEKCMPFGAEAYCMKEVVVKVQDVPSVLLGCGVRPFSRQGAAKEVKHLKEDLNLQVLKPDHVIIGGAGFKLIASSMKRRTCAISEDLLEDMQQHYADLLAELKGLVRRRPGKGAAKDFGNYTLPLCKLQSTTEMQVEGYMQIS